MAETDLKQAAPPTVEVAGAGAGSQLKKVELDLDDGVKVNYEKLQTAADGKMYPVLGRI